MKKKLPLLILVIVCISFSFITWQVLLLKRVNEKANLFIDGSERLMEFSYLAMLDTSQPDVQKDYPDLSTESFDYFVRQAISSLDSNNEQVRNADLAIDEYLNRTSKILQDYKQSIDYGEESLQSIKQASIGLLIFKKTYSDRINNFETLIDFHYDYYQAQKEILTSKYNLMVAISESGSITSQQSNAILTSQSISLKAAGENYKRTYDAINALMLEIERAQINVLYQL